MADPDNETRATTSIFSNPLGAGMAAVSAVTMMKDAVKESGGIINAAKDMAKGFVSSDILRDWRHASRLYIDDKHRLSPKFGFLFHVSFDLDEAVESIIPKNSKYEHGMLVKGFSLPRFTVDTKTLNSYNRPDIVQTKIKYETVEITFHDDSANVITQLWDKYYRYYYRDADGMTDFDVRYRLPFRYADTGVDDKRWGYTLDNDQSLSSNGSPAPFFRSINLFSLSQKKFTRYTLIRPIVKSLTLGNHNASGNTDIMEIKMVLEYEVVLYSNGTVTNKLPNFADLHYDKGPSPLSALGGGAQNIFGENGLLSTGESILGDINNGNIASALFKGAKAAGTFSGQNLGKMLIGEIGQMGRDVISNRPIEGKAGVLFPTPNVGKELIKATNNAASNGTPYKTEGYFDP